MSAIKKYIRNPKSFFKSVLNKTANVWPDKLYLKMAFYLRTGKKLDLKNPKSFSDKLNWLKINDIHPEYSTLVDKITVKEIIAKKLGSTENIIKTIGVWDTVEEIDFSALPDKFVLKTSNGGGNTSVYICKDKAKVNLGIIRQKIKTINSHKLYQWSREYPYYAVPPRIMAEEYIESTSSELKDYKFFCFNGKVKFLKVDTDRNTHHHATYLFPDWTKAPFKEGNFPTCEELPEKPQNYHSMIQIAEKISHNIPFVRVDLYNVNGYIYFGEMTFFPVAGFDIFQPNEWDLYIGDYLQLPKP